MTNTLSRILLAAIILAALAAGAVANADEFGGRTTSEGANAALDKQAKDAGLSDPTARDSLRSHGQP